MKNNIIKRRAIVVVIIW